MFGLMTRGEHEAAMLIKESELVYERNRNQTLVERIRLGEDYRGRLEAENASLRDANRRLVYEKEEAEAERQRAGNRVRELQLMCGSYEAHLAARSREPAEA